MHPLRPLRPSRQSRPWRRHLRVRHLPGIRWQLTLWYATSVLVILALAAGIFALSFKGILDVQVDTQLHAQAQQIAEDTSIVDGQLHFAMDPEIVSPWTRVLDRNGKVVYTSPPLRGVLLKPDSVLTPLAGGDWKDTVRLETLHLVRFYARPLRLHTTPGGPGAAGTIVGVVQVGQPLDLITATAGLSALVLALLLPVLLLVCLGGSFWLSGLALAPVRRLTRLANAVQDSGDLRQRVPLPRAHDEMHALAETLNAMLARLDMAFALQRRFIADASHDLRSPVAALLSLAENARDGVGDRSSAQALQDIAEQAQRLGHLVTNLLQLTRADEGRLQSEWEPIRLDLLVRDAAVSLLPLANDRQIDLRPGELDAVQIEGDVAQLLLVVLNLVDNALTYTLAGGRVTLSVRRVADQRAVLTVEDTGIGIDPDDLPYIFDRFYRADPARRRATGGSGLGLAIVRALVNNHHGSISAGSVPGKGATFIVTLPALSRGGQGEI
jgi:signal transduction histidine kinase